MEKAVLVSRRCQQQPWYPDLEWKNQRARRMCGGVVGAMESPDVDACGGEAWRESASAEDLQSQDVRRELPEKP
jgi:hypothetical protein